MHRGEWLRATILWVKNETKGRYIEECIMTMILYISTNICTRIKFFVFIRGTRVLVNHIWETRTKSWKLDYTWYKLFSFIGWKINLQTTNENKIISIHYITTYDQIYFWNNKILINKPRRWFKDRIGCELMKKARFLTTDRSRFIYRLSPSAFSYLQRS